MIREFALACARENQCYVLACLEETALPVIVSAAEDFVVLAIDRLNTVTDVVLDEVSPVVWRNILRGINEEHTAPLVLERSQRVILEFIRFDMPEPRDADTIEDARLAGLRRALLRLEVTRMLRRFYVMCRSPGSLGSLDDFFLFLSEVRLAAVLILGVIVRPSTMHTGRCDHLREADKEAVPLFAVLDSAGQRAADANAKVAQMADIQAGQIEQSVLEMHAVLDNILVPVQ